MGLMTLGLLLVNQRGIEDGTTGKNITSYFAC
jgi:hypothetical protein